MSSFNYSSPYNLEKSNSFGPSGPGLSVSSTLNPTASSYIPLNAGAAPYVPLPPQMNICKPIPRAKKRLSPSFAYYEEMNSSQIYNSTRKYHENALDHVSCASSAETLETLETPIPASVTSSVYSECDSIDLAIGNIEPYVPTNRYDIDDIHDIGQQNTNHKHENINISIISETSDCEPPHPAIAALSAIEYKQLLNAPVWSPHNNNNNNSRNHKRHFAKIAIDEEDYQFILHPNKKPMKYGLHSLHSLHSSHTAYTSQIGESYDECTQMLIESLPTSNVAPAASTDLECTHYDTNTCYTNLYKSKPSRIAVEGFPDHDTAHGTNSHTPNIAVDVAHVSTVSYYGESQSRIASPFIEHVSYIHCIV